MKASYQDKKNGFDEIQAKSFKIIRTDQGINLQMEFSEKDAEGMLNITLNSPDLRELPKHTQKLEPTLEA